MENKKLLGRRIKEIRKSRGLTQEQLSEMIDIETSSLSGIESGRFYPSLHVLEKIAQVFEVELIEFFKFSTVNLPENLDKEILNIIERQDKKNKQLIYKLLNAAFITIS
jgi:transcriptional regulator, XRE family